MKLFTNRSTGKSVYFSKRGRRISDGQLKEIFRMIWDGQGALALAKYDLTQEDIQYLGREAGKVS